MINYLNVLTGYAYSRCVIPHVLLLTQAGNFLLTFVSWPAAMASELVAPKQIPGGAFGRFLDECRHELLEECKGKPVTAVSKLAKERWNALSGPEKASWEKKYKTAKKKFEADVEEFLAAGGEMPKKKRKVKGDAGQFEQRLTKIHCFWLEQFKAVKEQVASGVAVGCKTKRKSSEKDLDIAACVAKGSRLLAMQRRTGAKEGKKPRRPKNQKAKAPKKAKDPDEPKKPVGGAYQCYMSDNRPKLAAQCKGQPSSAINKLAADSWKKLSAQERKPFDEAYKVKQKEYETAMKAYKAKKLPAEEPVADAALAGA